TRSQGLGRNRECGHCPRGETPRRRRPTRRHRRRVPARHLFRRLHQRRHFRREDRNDGGTRLDQVAKPWPPDGAAHSNGCRPHRLEGTTERRRLSLSQVADHAHAQDHAPEPLLHSLSRGARQYQPRCLSRPRHLLVRPGRSLRPRNALARGRRMPLSADRRNVAGETRRSARASVAGGARRRLARSPAHLRRCVNAVVAGAPEGMTIGIHVSRSQDPSWQADVGYDPIAEPLFNAMKVDNYFLEYDNARAGTFAPMRCVPEGKLVVLGLVASKVSELESVDVLKRRIEEASRYVKLEQLGLSPQCGFATSAAEHGKVTEEVERAKLARIVEVARQVWGSA